MQKITAVVITFNEEKKIGKCLASLEGIADEIIVLDSFSTDATSEICKKHGVQFYQQQWLGYGQQKNAAAQKATYDYILSLDADEFLSEELKQSILKEKTGGLSGVYQVTRLNNFYGKFLHHGSTYPDKTNRLYDRTKIQWSVRHVHETLDIPTGTTITKLKGDLLHLTKDSIADHIIMINKYSSLSAQYYFETAKKGSLINILINPLASFIKSYFLRRGFLDGYEGFIMAKISAHEVFLKYSKLLLLQQQNKNKNQ